MPAAGQALLGSICSQRILAKTEKQENWGLKRFPGDFFFFTSRRPLEVSTDVLACSNKVHYFLSI